MRFKNFINNFSKKNIIFSDEDMFNMSLGDIFDNEDELFSQYKAIGFPSEAELQASPNVVYVHAYVKDDGTQVRAHWRSLPDGTSNINPNRAENYNYPILEGYVSTNNIAENIKQFARDNIKPYRDYEKLTPIEQAQKYVSKHFSIWTPAEYYGISEYLADDGKLPEKYKKHNYHCKLGDITNERTQKIISDKVQRVWKDCPVGPFINTPLKDVDVIIPRNSSELVQKVKRSDEIKDFIEKKQSKTRSWRSS